MNIKRRKRIGNTLLIAGAGASIAMGCNRRSIISGNLMPPPMSELCIEVKPQEAAVRINSFPLTNENCISSYDGGNALIEATAEGYQDYTKEIIVMGPTNHVIEMVPKKEEESEKQEEGKEKE